jgi:hypothetical protein
MRKKRKFLVIETRRLVPLLFLLLLLIGLTVYDNFFRVEQAVGPSEAIHEHSLAFTTTDWGVFTPPASFTLVADHEGWARVVRELDLSLPDYPFNAAEEIALFAVNSEIQSMELLPVLGEMQVRVLVEPKENYFHVVTVERQSVDLEGVVWKFMDNHQQVLSRILPFWHGNEDAGEEGEGEEEEETLK